MSATRLLDSSQDTDIATTQVENRSSDTQTTLIQDNDDTTSLEHSTGTGEKGPVGGDGGEKSLEYIIVHYGARTANVHIERDSDIDTARRALYKPFADLIPDPSVVRGIYKYSFGPTWPLDVIATHAPSFASTTDAEFFLYVVPGSTSDTAENQQANLPDPASDPTIPHKPVISPVISLAPHHATSLKLPSSVKDSGEALYHSRLFTSLLRQYGYVRFTLPQKKWKIIDVALQEIKTFFAQSDDYKGRCAEHPFGGYREMSNKEIFYVHRMFFDMPSKIWPKKRKSFRKAIIAYYNLCADIAIELMEAIAISLHLPPDVFKHLLDDIPRPWKVATAMQIFQYNPFDHHAHLSAVQCREHPDTSLLTLAPCSTQPELLMVERHTGQWCSVEMGAGPHDIIVFPGTYLARLTAGYFIAPLHRVIHEGTDSRISTPFFLRARPDASLNPHTLFAHQAAPQTAPTPTLDHTAVPATGVAATTAAETTQEDNASSMYQLRSQVAIRNSSCLVDRTVHSFLEQDVIKFPVLK